MEVLLSKVTQQAMNYAIRTGITITSGFAMQQCSRLLKNVKGSSDKTELATLQMRLESKIRIISPAIDMIELIAARGNTMLESAVTLTKSLRWDIQTLGVRLSKAAAEEELTRRGSTRAKSVAHNAMELKSIIAEIKAILIRIEDAVPLINLAITTSGVSLSTSLPDSVSPSRLLQASTLLTSGDAQYAMDPSRAMQICPDFTLSMYMLFSSHAYRPHDVEGARETTWKEVIHKARLRILRVPLDRVYDYPGDNETSPGHEKPAHLVEHGSMAAEGQAYEYAYQLLVVEDLDDGRVHTYEDGEPQPGPYEGVELAGIRELIPVHEISKIFYADTGKILNIGNDGESNNPVLLLKRDINAVPPRRMMRRQTSPSDQYADDSSIPNSPEEAPQSPPTYDEQSEIDQQLFRESPAPPSPPPAAGHTPSAPPWRLPPNLDPEWIAFEVFTDDDNDLSDDLSETSEPASTTSTPSRRPSASPSLMTSFSRLSFRPTTPQTTTSSPTLPSTNLILSPSKPTPETPPPIPQIRTSLSLLEMLIRLTALQQFQQSSHLAIPDELLTFFLAESSTVGAGGDAELRQRVRRDARRRVGFDPYDESPIKRRGERYLAAAREDAEWTTEEDGVYGEEFGLGSPELRTPKRVGSSSSTAVGRSGDGSVPREGLSSPFVGNRASPSPYLRKATAGREGRGGNGAGQGMETPEGRRA